MASDQPADGIGAACLYGQATQEDLEALRRFRAYLNEQARIAREQEKQAIEQEKNGGSSDV